MPKTLYGVYIMNPADFVMNTTHGDEDYHNRLPDDTDEPILFFEKRDSALEYIRQNSTLFKVPVGANYCGKDGPILTFCGIGILYSVECPSAAYKKMPTAEQMVDKLPAAFHAVVHQGMDGSAIRVGSCGDDSDVDVRDIKAYFGDDLNDWESVFLCYDGESRSSTGLAFRISSRWWGLRDCDETLRHSTPAMLHELDLNDSATMAALKHIYNERGLINRKFSVKPNLFPTETKELYALRYIEAVVHVKRLGIGYETAFLKMEELYRATYLQAAKENCTHEDCITRAADAVLTMLSEKAEHYNDTHAQQTFAKMRELCENGIICKQTNSTIYNVAVYGDEDEDEDEYDEDE